MGSSGQWAVGSGQGSAQWAVRSAQQQCAARSKKAARAGGLLLEPEV